MATYTTAPGSVRQHVELIVRAHYPILEKYEVTFDLLMAHAARDKHGNPKGPALKLHNWPALAIVRVIPLKQRVAGRSDVEICFDGDQWDELSPSRQDAIIDHELRHLEVIEDESDDCGRPKIKLLPHDWQGGFFFDVLKRHGYASVEHAALSELAEKTQGLFSWATVA